MVEQFSKEFFYRLTHQPGVPPDVVRARPCPFCGSLKLCTPLYREAKRACIECNSCGALGPMVEAHPSGDHEEWSDQRILDSVEAWNRRVVRV